MGLFNIIWDISSPFASLIGLRLLKAPEGALLRRGRAGWDFAWGAAHDSRWTNACIQCFRSDFFHLQLSVFYPQKPLFVSLKISILKGCWWFLQQWGSRNSLRSTNACSERCASVSAPVRPIRRGDSGWKTIEIGRLVCAFSEWYGVKTGFQVVFKDGYHPNRFCLYLKIFKGF